MILSDSALIYWEFYLGRIHKHESCCSICLVVHRSMFIIKKKPHTHTQTLCCENTDPCPVSLSVSGWFPIQSPVERLLSPTSACDSSLVSDLRLSPAITLLITALMTQSALRRAKDTLQFLPLWRDGVPTTPPICLSLFICLSHCYCSFKDPRSIVCVCVFKGVITQTLHVFWQ